MQTITIDVKNKKIATALISFLSDMKSVEIRAEKKILNVAEPNATKKPVNVFEEFVGIWKDKDIDANTLRKKAWGGRGVK